MSTPTMLQADIVKWPRQMINSLLIFCLVLLALVYRYDRRESPPAAAIISAPTIPPLVIHQQMKRVARGEVPPGLTARDWAGINGAYERHRHAAYPVGGAPEARNYTQQWLARFDVRGFTVEPQGSSWRWGLELQSYGFSGRERTIASQAEVKTAIERVTYAWSDELDEWYINDQRGLEHGFTIIDRLAAFGITLGCNPEGTQFCPSSAVTREQMAAFLVRAFNL